MSREGEASSELREGVSMAEDREGGSIQALDADDSDDSYARATLALL